MKQLLLAGLVAAVLGATVGAVPAGAVGDTTPPVSAASPPAVSTTTTFDIPYTASDEVGGSGLAKVELYAKAPGELLYSLVDTDLSPDTPVFSYTATAGDGQYSFYTVATDNDGNPEIPPLTGDDGTTLVDTTPPVTSAGAPASSGVGAIAITYTQTDADSVELWAKAPGDSSYSLADTDTSPGTPSFSYTPAGGDGSYAFYTIGIDNHGNHEAAPASADTTTMVDTTAPVSSASAPTASTNVPFTVTYTAVDVGVGVQSVELWVKRPGDASYALTATDTTPASPSFSYTPNAGQGTYAFYTVATDSLGNREAAPASADDTTVVDTTAPTSSATTPTQANGTVTVGYTASDSGSGVASVELWVRRPGDANYSLAATDTTPASPSFSYTPNAGDGNYRFYTIAIDGAGNREAVPANADATIMIDTSAPTSSASAPAASTAAAITVSYTATDAGSGVASVELWVKRPGDASFSLAGTDTTPASPSFSYTPAAGDGSYAFYTVAVDAVGNRESAPASADATTLVDSTAPTSSASAPATSTGGAITVTYTASDTGSGAASVELWVKRPGDASFSLAATDTTPASPSFSYTPAAGDGSYAFYTIAVDTAGNREAAPASADATTVRDANAPTSSASAPASSAGGPITVTYTAADAGSGVASVELWVKRPGDANYSLAQTDTTPASASFTYTPAAGDGGYAFYTIAIDGFGNREAAPASADATTLVDTAAPTSSASAPSQSGGGPITVTYSASDPGLGVASVELWVKRPGDANYSFAATDTTPASPSFSYTPTAGDGSYSFYTIAVDVLGNREAAPASADATTAVTTAAPTSSASAPSQSGGGPITVTYTATAGGSAVASVELWVKRPGDSSYSLTATDTTPASPSFSYTPAAGDGRYAFYTIAIDTLNNREPAPNAADATTLVDTTAPTSSASAPTESNGGAITVTYTASDAGSGVASVELWVKRPGDSSFSLISTDTTPASASFSYTPAVGDGNYAFYTVAIDAVGNREAASASADATTLVNTKAPNSSASAPASWADGPITVTYTASPAGSAVASVELWVKRPGDASFSLASTDTTPASASFSYTPAAGDGNYAFYTVAIDTVNNHEPAPNAADATTRVDTTAPTSNASAPATSTGGPITIDYAASDTGVGVGSVELWVRRPGDSVYSFAATDATPDSPSFSYTPAAGDGDYGFYTIAVDSLGNREGAPGSADATTHMATPAPPPPSSDPTPPASSSPVGTAPPPPPAQGSTTTQPSLPLVAAVTLPRGQKLATVLKTGLTIRLFAYRAVRLHLVLTISNRLAKGLRIPDARVALHTWDVSKSGVYVLKLRLRQTAAKRLRVRDSVRFRLRNVITTPSSTSTSTSAFTLSRR